MPRVKPKKMKLDLSMILKKVKPEEIDPICDEIQDTHPEMMKMIASFMDCCDSEEQAEGFLIGFIQMYKIHKLNKFTLPIIRFSEN